MKKLSLIFLFIFLEFICSGQNLIINSSFEDTTSCPNSPGQVNMLMGWSSYGQSPDYFNTCTPSCLFPGTCFGIPHNVFGSQQAFDGNAYVGLTTYTENFPFHEFIGIQLIYPLVIGERYFISAYVSRAGGYNCFGASNNIGFRFFMNSYSMNDSCPVDNFSHVNETNIVADSVNWTRVEGSFIADSAYQYFAIGNFYDDQHTDTINIDNNNPFTLNHAYYYIDFVCVSADSLNCSIIPGTTEIDKTSLNIKITPNPFDEKLFVECTDNSIKLFELFDICGRKIFRQNFVHSISIDTQNFEEGIYLYVVNDKRGLVENGKIIKH